MEIMEGIHLIENPHSAYFVSSALIEGESLTLVDAGRVESPETSIYPTIRELGRDPREISLVVLTHAHWDHCAGVAQIKEETGCRVAVHADGAPYLSDPQSAPREFSKRFPEILPGNMGNFEAVEPDMVFTNGSTITLGERELRVVHTPGHSTGSCCIVEPDIGLYIAGDSIQGRGEGRPLIFHDMGDYLASMKRLLDEPIEIIVNGHPFPPSGAGVLRGEETRLHIEESIRAVEELKGTVLTALERSEGPMSAMEIHQATGAARPFTIGCILEALEAEGLAAREPAEGRILWQT